MSVGWSRRKREEPDHPDQPVIVTVVGLDFDSATGLTRVRVAGDRIPYARPDGEQEDDVIEPTAVFKPWLPYTAWDQCIIETWTDEV